MEFCICNKINSLVVYLTISVGYVLAGFQKGNEVVRVGLEVRKGVSEVRLAMENKRAFNQVVPDFGAEAKSISLSCAWKWRSAAILPRIAKSGNQQPLNWYSTGTLPTLSTGRVAINSSVFLFISSWSLTSTYWRRWRRRREEELVLEFLKVSSISVFTAK